MKTRRTLPGCRDVRHRDQPAGYGVRSGRHRGVLFLSIRGAFALADFGSVVEAPGPRFGILAAPLALAVPAAFVTALTRHGVPSR
jgi:hypothetical protein